MVLFSTLTDTDLPLIVIFGVIPVVVMFEFKAFWEVVFDNLFKIV